MKIENSNVVLSKEEYNFLLANAKQAEQTQELLEIVSKEVSDLIGGEYHV